MHPLDSLRPTTIQTTTTFAGFFVLLGGVGCVDFSARQGHDHPLSLVEWLVARAVREYGSGCIAAMCVSGQWTFPAAANRASSPRLFRWMEDKSVMEDIFMTLLACAPLTYGVQVAPTHCTCQLLVDLDLLHFAGHELCLQQRIVLLRIEYSAGSMKSVIVNTANITIELSL